MQMGGGGVFAGKTGVIGFFSLSHQRLKSKHISLDSISLEFQPNQRGGLACAFIVANRK